MIAEQPKQSESDITKTHASWRNIDGVEKKRSQESLRAKLNGEAKQVVVTASPPNVPKVNDIRMKRPS